MGKRQWPYVWQQIDALGGEVLTRGTCTGLPVLAWGWAPADLLATYRQLQAAGLRPGGADPVACLHFGHHQPGRRSLTHAALYAVATAVPKRTATPRQLGAIRAALTARRTCRACRQVQTYYPSTLSRMCTECEDRTDFWAVYALERGFGWPTATAA